jgi:phage terminase large subunit-like protein
MNYGLSDRDRLVWQGPTGLTGRSDRSDRSRRSPSQLRRFCRIRSVIGIPCGISPPHPINMKGHGRLRRSNRTKSIQTLIFTFSPNPSFSNLRLLFFLRLRDVWRRSRWHANPRTTLRAPTLTGPSQVSVRRLANFHRRPVWPVDQSDLSTQEELHRALSHAAWSSAIVCWSVKGVNTIRVACVPHYLYPYLSYPRLCI